MRWLQSLIWAGNPSSPVPFDGDRVQRIFHTSSILISVTVTAYSTKVIVKTVCHWLSVFMSIDTTKGCSFVFWWPNVLNRPPKFFGITFSVVNTVFYICTLQVPFHLFDPSDRIPFSCRILLGGSSVIHITSMIFSSIKLVQLSGLVNFWLIHRHLTSVKLTRVSVPVSLPCNYTYFYPTLNWNKS